MSKCHIIGNHMHWLINIFVLAILYQHYSFRILLSIAEESCLFENFPMSICVKDIMKRVSSPTHVEYFYPFQKNHAVLRIFL